jgi:hypothetical protein
MASRRAVLVGGVLSASSPLHPRQASCLVLCGGLGRPYSSGGVDYTWGEVHS